MLEINFNYIAYGKPRSIIRLVLGSLVSYGFYFLPILLGCLCLFYLESEKIVCTKLKAPFLLDNDYPLAHNLQWNQIYEEKMNFSRKRVQEQNLPFSICEPPQPGIAAWLSLEHLHDPLPIMNTEDFIQHVNVFGFSDLCNIIDFSVERRQSNGFFEII